MSDANSTQIELWDGRVGEKWAALQPRLDIMLSPATAELKRRAGSVAGQRVLDIGCGAGVTCLLWLESGAAVTGVDVSGPMLAVAASRTGGRARLLKADATVWRDDAPFDFAVSQFGVMFFADPDLAFANIAANLRPGGRLLFVCWRPAAENQWVTVPMAVIDEVLPPSSPSSPDAPGPFAFADRDRVQGILERAGFTDIAIEPFDFPVCLASEGGAEAAAGLATQIGASGQALAGASKEILVAARTRLTAAFAPYDTGGRVALGGAVWVVEAIRAR